MEQCEYCTGNSYKRKPLMQNGKGDYYVSINSCNYLELEIETLSFLYLEKE